jgi:hypothetical protein
MKLQITFEHAYGLGERLNRDPTAESSRARPPAPRPAGLTSERRRTSDEMCDLRRHIRAHAGRAQRRRRDGTRCESASLQAVRRLAVQPRAGHGSQGQAVPQRVRPAGGGSPCVTTRLTISCKTPCRACQAAGRSGRPVDVGGVARPRRRHVGVLRVEAVIGGSHGVSGCYAPGRWRGQRRFPSHYPMNRRQSCPRDAPGATRC